MAGWVCKYLLQGLCCPGCYPLSCFGFTYNLKEGENCMQHRWCRRFDWQAGTCLLGLVILMISGSTWMAQAGSANPYLIAQQISWGDILSQLRRSRKNFGGRGGLCLLIPASAREPEVLWHDRPLFVWQGFEHTVGLRQTGSETVFWRRSLSQTGTIVNQIQYTGQPLQPGQTYDLLLFSSPTNSQPVRWQPFTVMADPDRAAITADLQTLTTMLKDKKLGDEAIAQQRARYFGLHQLMSDVLQEVYGVKHPSAELRQKTQAIATDICNPSDSEK